MKKIAIRKRRLSINTYGYDYTPADFISTLLIFSITVSGICYLHKMNAIYSLIVIGTLIVMLPILISSYFMYKHEKTRFEEYCKYFDYMKIYFKTYKKIKLALENVILLFPEKSHMHSCIHAAIQEISETGNYEQALSIIDRDYHNSYLERLHNLLITGEQHGSDSVYENLDLINFEAWKDDIQTHQNRKKTFRYMLYGMTIFSVGLSFYGVQMFADVMEDIYIDASYQFYTFLDIEGMMLLFLGIYISFVNKKWIRSDD